MLPFYFIFASPSTHQRKLFIAPDQPCVRHTIWTICWVTGGRQRTQKLHRQTESIRIPSCDTQCKINSFAHIRVAACKFFFQLEGANAYFLKPKEKAARNLAAGSHQSGDPFGPWDLRSAARTRKPTCLQWAGWMRKTSGRCAGEASSISQPTALRARVKIKSSS